MTTTGLQGCLLLEMFCFRGILSGDVDNDNGRTMIHRVCLQETKIYVNEFSNAWKVITFYVVIKRCFLFVAGYMYCLLEKTHRATFVWASVRPLRRVENVSPLKWDECGILIGNADSFRTLGQVVFLLSVICSCICYMNFCCQVMHIE